MEKQYAYMQSVTNKQKKSSAATEYIQLITENKKVYFFTERELAKAEERAAKNIEDQQIVEVEYQVIYNNINNC